MISVNTKKLSKKVESLNTKKYKKPLAFGIARVELSAESEVMKADFLHLNWDSEEDIYKVYRHFVEDKNILHDTKEEFVAEINSSFISDTADFFAEFTDTIYEDLENYHNMHTILTMTALNQDMLYYNTSDSSKGKAKFRLVAIFEDKKCQAVESVYVKLLAISKGYAKVRSLNLDGIFGVLKNVAWSGNKPYSLKYLRDNEKMLRATCEYPVIDMIDKIPRYLISTLPTADNIRMLDSAKTRLGAYLGSGGYTQMPGASYINFNSGVEGVCMNEGRISSSVMVGEGTDVGGGASILGVLSGGNEEAIAIARNCLLGANSVTGISLGDACIVDAGIAVLAGTVFEISTDEQKKIQKVNDDFELRDNMLYKGRELSGKNGLHFRQNSKNGKMIAMRSKREIKLNKDLH